MIDTHQNKKGKLKEYWPTCSVPFYQHENKNTHAFLFHSLAFLFEGLIIASIQTSQRGKHHNTSNPQRLQLLDEILLITIRKC